jgi:hypothetical protein
MIQSKHPPLGPMIDQARVPLVTTEIVMNVELVSPLNKHPEFPGTGLGFIEGLEILPDVKSIMFVEGLLGAIGKDGVVQPGIASTQSLGCAETKSPSNRNKGRRNFILLLFAAFEWVWFYDIYTVSTDLNTTHLI